MRGALLLVLGLAACAGGPEECAAFSPTRGHSVGQKCGNGVVEGTETCDDGNNTDGDACSADCTKQLTFDYKPGLSSASTHVLPPCTAGNNCILQCTAFASGALWRCVDGSGNAQTVVAGTETVATNPWGLQAIRVFSDANAPTITAPSGADTCFATTLIGSSTDGSKVMPATSWGGFNIGCRYTNTLCMEGTIQRVSVWARR